MEVIRVEELLVKGISVRTNNADEMNPDQAKIGKLWQQFDQQVPVDYQHGERVYGIYSDYESDASGEFTVLAGYVPNDPSTAVSHSLGSHSACSELEQVTIPSGNYLVFHGEGDMPQVVIDTWMKVWDYFSQPDASHQRAFTVDFEFYRSEREVEIHIAIL